MELTQSSLLDAALKSANLIDPYCGVGQVEQGEASGIAVPDAIRIQHEVSGLGEEAMGPELESWVERYAQIGQRDRYLWHWCRQAVSVMTLSCVPAPCRAELCDTKTLGVMWDVLLDDLADRGEHPDLLEQLLRLPQKCCSLELATLDATARAYGQLAVDLWDELNTRAASYPRYHEFADLLRFDYLQLCNAMRYSQLLNADLDLLNLTEHDLYTPHNMHIMACATFDMMCSPEFDRVELGKLREIIWMAQMMGRIGNLVTTWQRELPEGDFTSGVYARAVSCGHLTAARLRAENNSAIEEVIFGHRHEQYFLSRWQLNRQKLLASRDQLQSLDVEKLVAGLDRLICLHLGSRGCK